jgi:hypothetical protein
LEAADDDKKYAAQDFISTQRAGASWTISQTSSVNTWNLNDFFVEIWWSKGSDVPWIEGDV